MQWLRALCLCVTLVITFGSGAHAEQVPSDPLLAEQLGELAMAAVYLRNFEMPAPRIEAFMWPVEGRISSGFGWRNVSVGGNRNHGGIDIVAGTGTPVAASKSGTVSFSGWNGAYGYVVFLDHADGSQTRYAHLSAYFKGAGDAAVQGETIGLVGSTGASTGPHLHFEIRRGGVAIDPLPVLRAAGGN